MSDSPNTDRGGRGTRRGGRIRGRGGERGGRGGSRGGWRDRGRGRGVEHSGERGGGRVGLRGDGRGPAHRSVGRGRGDSRAPRDEDGRGYPHGSDDSDQERGPSRSTRSPTPTPALRVPVRPPGGKSGKPIKLESNHVMVELDPRAIYQYDGMYLSSSGRDIWLRGLVHTPTRYS